MGIGLGDGLGLGAAVRDHDEPVSSLKNKAKKLWGLICSGMKDIAYAMASPEERNAMDLEEWTEKFIQDFFLKIPGETDPVFAKINEKTIQVGDILIQTHLESSRWLFVTIGGEQFRINRWQYDNANPKAKPFLPKDHVSIAFPNDSISIEGDVS